MEHHGCAAMVRIPPGPGSLLSVVCGQVRGLCDRSITHPEESCWVWRVWVWSWHL